MAPQKPNSDKINMNENYIEWIGTGSGLNPVLGNTAFLVKGGDRTLLVDCGCTVPLELIKSQQLKDVTDVVLTHTHADHIGGIEGFAFMNYFGFRNRGDKRPNLYVATDEFAQRLWENSLKGGLGVIQSDDNQPQNATLDTYFKIQIGKQINIPGLPDATLFPTLHVQNLENYGLNFLNGVFYSGDTVELPPIDPALIFQDCQFYESPSDVHISYDKLKRDLAPAVKAKTYLVHLGGGYGQKGPIADGFAGFVMPKQRFMM
jgi:phosphoribosyl 1,2-cyclic phosphodiesterase